MGIRYIGPRELKRFAVEVYNNVGGEFLRDDPIIVAGAFKVKYDEKTGTYLVSNDRKVNESIDPVINELVSGFTARMRGLPVHGKNISVRGVKRRLDRIKNFGSETNLSACKEFALYNRMLDTIEVWPYELFQYCTADLVQRDQNVGGNGVPVADRSDDIKKMRYFRVTLKHELTHRDISLAECMKAIDAEIRLVMGKNGESSLSASGKGSILDVDIQPIPQMLENFESEDPDIQAKVKRVQMGNRAMMGLKKTNELGINMLDEATALAVGGESLRESNSPVSAEKYPTLLRMFEHCRDVLKEDGQKQTIANMIAVIDQAYADDRHVMDVLGLSV